MLVLWQFLPSGGLLDHEHPIPFAHVRALASAYLVAAGTPPRVAEIVAHALTTAHAEGSVGHGLVRLPSYAAQVRVGKIDGAARVGVSYPKPAIALINAAHGFAFPALDCACVEVAQLAEQHGIAAAAVVRSHHCGSAGLYTERLAEKGLVAILFANTPGAMAPWQGRTALLGTNPIAFAAPLDDEAPMVIDLSLSRIARGKVLAAAQAGGILDEGTGFDARGRPSTDPESVLDGGTLAAIGGHKGAALAIMVEVLAAALIGATCAAEASSFLDDQGAPPGTGQLLIAISPSAFGGKAARARIAALAHAIAQDGDARLPGRMRQQRRQQAYREGLLLDGQTLRTLKSQP